MFDLPILGLFLATAVTAFSSSSISAISWGPGTVDVFGLAPDSSTIWHKYYRGGSSWEPSQGFENMNTTASLSEPSVMSTQKDRTDILYISTNNEARLRYWLGSDWSPATPENLGGNFSSPLALASWSADRINAVGRGQDMEYYHKFWDGTAWLPSTGWEEMGGNFSSTPALVSWGADRLDIFGIDSAGALKHKYWDGHQWNPSILEWEDMGGGPFIGKPVASSWGSGRMDMWAVGKDKALYHKYWDGSSYSDWELLGGSFDSAPQVVHWWPGRIDIVGPFAGASTGGSPYYYKYFDGSQWNPSPTDWYNKGGVFVGDAAVVAAGANNLNIMGVGDDGMLKLQVWDGSQWLPSATGWWDLGDTKHPFGAAGGDSKLEL